MLLPSTWSTGLPAPTSSRSSPPSSPVLRASVPIRPHARRHSQGHRMLAVATAPSPEWRSVKADDGGSITPRPGTPSHQHHASFPPSSGLGLGGLSTTATGRVAAILRPVMLLPDPLIYVVAIAIDLLLRLTWSLKLSSHLHSIHEIEQGVFLLEALEVVRRWMWVFIRVEWEQVRRGDDGRTDTRRSGGITPSSRPRPTTRRPTRTTSPSSTTAMRRPTSPSPISRSAQLSGSMCSRARISDRTLAHADGVVKSPWQWRVVLACE